MKKMIKKYQEFENLLLAKLETSSIGIVILDNSGSVCYENFNQINNKKEILTIATKTIEKISEVVKKLDTKYPEFLIFKGNKAFLILIPSLCKKQFYGVFGNTSLGIGMTRICLQNTIHTFEKQPITEQLV